MELLNLQFYKQNKNPGNAFVKLLENTSGLHQCANSEWDVWHRFLSFFFFKLYTKEENGVLRTNHLSTQSF